MTHRLRRRSALGVLLSLALVAGCHEDDPTTLRDTDPEVPTVPDQGVYGYLAAGAFDAQTGLQDVHVRIGAADRELSAYEGRVTFPSGSLTLEEVRTPSGDFHVVNPEEEGILRFAGFSTGSFDGPVELVLTFATSAPIAAGQVTLGLDVVGTPEGRRVSRDEMEVPEDLFDLAKIVQGEGEGEG